MSHMRPSGLEKPRKGTAKRLTQARKRLADSREDAAKLASKLRDGMASRYPHVPQDGTRLESAHLVAKGRGGDVTGRVSWKRSDYVTLTANQHARQHAGYLRIVPLTEDGGDGLVEFWIRESLHSPWIELGASAPPREDAA